MNLLDIFLIILIISASALCFALIFYLWKISVSVKAMEDDLKQLSINLDRLINSTSILANNLTDMSNNVKGQLDTSRNIVTSIKERIETILEFEEYVRKGIEGPVRTFIREIMAINNGINTFLKKIRIKDS